MPVDPITATAVSCAFLMGISLRPATDPAPTSDQERMMRSSIMPRLAVTEMPGWYVSGVDAPLSVTAAGPIGDLAAPSAMTDAIRAKLAAYSQLPQGWDRDDSPPAHSAAVAAAGQFLDTLPFGVPFPRVSLTPDGEPEFYWDMPGGYVDLRFTADGTASLFASNSADEEVFHDHIAPVFNSLPDRQFLVTILAPTHLPHLM